MGPVLPEAVSRALTAAGLQPIDDPMSADGVLTMKVDPITTTFEPYRTTLNLTPKVQDEARRLNRDQTPQLLGAGLTLR